MKMQAITVVETCGECGAVCAAEDWQPRIVQLILAAFRAAHKECRSQAAEVDALNREAFDGR